MSLVPAGVNGTITRTGRSGIWPKTGSAADVIANSTNVASRMMALSVASLRRTLASGAVKDKEPNGFKLKAGQLIDTRPHRPTLAPFRGAPTGVG
jgi:hypothetical protein